MTAKGEFFPRRTNDHVPNMQYAADVRVNGIGTIEIPTPIAGSASISEVTGTVGKTEVNIDTGAKFGRNIIVTPDVAAGAAITVTVEGTDYLGQPMIENFAVPATGTAAVSGNKAFRYVTAVSVSADSAGAINIGTGNKLGLPYRLIDNYSEVVDKVEAATAGAVVAGANVVQTATSADPRGTYAPHTSVAPNGERSYELTGLFDRTNLHGNPHFFS